mgnify:CR=1 FL=1
MAASAYVERVNTFLRDKDDSSEDALKQRLIRWFEEAEEATREGREKAERDQDYYDGKQLTVDEVQTLKDRGQPPVAINLIRRKVDTLRGMEVKQRSDPKAWPRTPADEDSAEVATDTLRYVFDAAKYNQNTRKWVWKDIIVVGWGGVQLQLKKERRPDKIARAMGVEPNKKLVRKRTHWDRMFWDPHSAEHDFSDCLYRGLVLWKDKSTALDMYRDNPKAQEIIESTFDSARVGETYDDKPKTQWVDATRKRIRIVQIWWKEMGDVMWAEFVQGGILDGGPSPFEDEGGDPCDNFVWSSCYVDRDNNRHGVVRDMIDPQDEINKRRSKALHLLTMRQVRSDQGAVADVEKAKRQLARPDGWVETTPGLTFEVLENQDLSAGQMSLLQHATTELEKMGPDESLQGGGSATSGRDRQAQQQAALIAPSTALDDLMWLDHRCYTLAWATVQRYWTAPQFIRVTDNEDAPKFIGINEPMIDQASGQMVGQRNKPAEIDVDIIIQPAPDTVAIEQEVWTDFTELLPVIAQMPPHLQEFTIQLSPLAPSRKRMLIEILQKGNEQAQPNPMQQRAVEAEVAGKEATALDKQAAAQLKQAQTAKIGKEIATPEQGQAPATPLDMARIGTEHARQQHMGAQTENLRVKTFGEASDIRTREVVTAADLAQKQADTRSTEMDTVATLDELINPKPQPKPVAKPAGAR